MLVLARENWWRLSVLDVPKSTLKDLQRDVDSWVRHSGVDWAIKRLKSVKIDLIRHKTGLPPLTYLAKNRKGQLKGWVGSIFRLSEKGDKSFGHCIQALMSYTMFVHGKVTPNQWEKFISGVQSQETYIPLELKKDMSKTAQQAIGVSNTSFIGKQKSILFYQGSPSKKAPVVSGPSVCQNQFMERELEVLLTPMGRSLYSKYRNSFCFVLDDLDGAKNKVGGYSQLYGVPKFERSELIAGNIGFIQEPGGKLRSVASPFRIYQRVLQPLGDALFDILKDLPWDCTHDQSKALPVIQEALRKGNTVHCVDLSAATDYFPLELQLTTLKSIFGHQELIDLFEDLSRAAWRTRQPDCSSVRWTRGQPMGLYPSFASFGLTHGLLLLTLAKGQYHGQFFVVGDDVVILDDRLAKAYQETLRLLECPFSPDKTISSSVLAEFAGKIITRDMIIPQLKWRNVSDNNFVDIMKLLGHRAAKILTKHQRRVYELIKSWYYPYGCNHSEGASKPLSEVYYNTLVDVEKVFGQKRGRDSLVDLSSQVRKDHYGPDKLYKYLSRSILKTVSTFDEKVARTFQHTVFGSMVRKDIHSAKIFADMVEGKDYSCLPLVRKEPAKQTLLEWYEKKLDIS